MRHPPGCRRLPTMVGAASCPSSVAGQMGIFHAVGGDKTTHTTWVRSAGGDPLFSAASGGNPHNIRNPMWLGLPPQPRKVNALQGYRYHLTRWHTTGKGSNINYMSGKVGNITSQRPIPSRTFKMGLYSLLTRAASVQSEHGSGSFSCESTPRVRIHEGELGPRHWHVVRNSACMMHTKDC